MPAEFSREDGGQLCFALRSGFAEQGHARPTNWATDFRAYFVFGGAQQFF
jgi:hypothetical protein